MNLPTSVAERSQVGLYGTTQFATEVLRSEVPVPSIGAREGSGFDQC